MKLFFNHKNKIYIKFKQISGEKIMLELKRLIDIT